MKQILIIVYDMLPYSKTWGGCQRMYFLAKELQNQGNKVKVIAFRRDKYNTYGKEPLKDVVFTEGHEATITPNSNVSRTTNGSEPDYPLWLKKIIYGLDNMFFNEIQKGNGIKSYIKYRRGRNALETILNENLFDVAIVSCPPFTLFNSVSLIKKLSPSTRVIMDYRDPWNSWHERNKYTAWREMRTQKKADMIVCTNQALCEDMSRKFRIPLESYRAFSNGFIKADSDSRIISTPEIKEGCMNIVYTGSVGFEKQSNDYRNTGRLMVAFEDVIKEGYPIRLIFVGVKNPIGVEVMSLKEKFGDHLHAIGVVSNTVALAYVENSDACLLLHTSSDNSGKFLISGKAYDYIQKRKYILSIANDDSLHARIVHENKIGENAVNEVQPIKEMLIRSYEKWKNGILNDVYKNIQVEQFSRAIHIEKYIELIRSL